MIPDSNYCQVMIMMSVLALGGLPENNLLHRAKLEPDRIFLYMVVSYYSFK